MTSSYNETLSAVNFLAEDIGEQMASRLDLMILKPQVVVVIGWGGDLLKNRYGDAQIIEMASGLSIPRPDLSVDLIFANLSLPWCRDVKAVMREWRRVLRPDGLLMFSSLGPDTLIELRAAFADFILPDLTDMHNLGDDLIQSRFADPVMDVENLTVTYRQWETLLGELKATNMLVNDAPALEWAPNSEGIYGLTYEVIYGHAWGPDPGVDNVADESGVVRIPLAHLRRR